MSRRLRAYCAVAFILAAPGEALSQSGVQLPPIVVEGAPAGNSTTGGSLTVPTAEQARKEIDNTPGGVEVVPDTAWKDKAATTIKQIVDYVPGVWAQPKWGEDTRLSIRGSGLSRNFHGRSIQMYMNGIPLNTADGYFDFQEIDPSAYRFVEIFKGANALRFGANALGGAINFVVPSGYDAHRFQTSGDAGGFGLKRLQASSGGVFGAFDYFVTGSAQQQDGFRQHSDGELERAFANVGYRLAPGIETRFYFNGNTIDQRIPGGVTKASALATPRTAAAINVLNDWQRNIRSNRVANKTTFQNDTTTTEVGAFLTDRHLMHPIFQWLDYDYQDYGGFTRTVDERMIGGFKNRFVAGVNIHNGTNDAKQFENNANAVKGALLFSALQKSKNLSAYAENSFYFLPNVAFIAGTQYLHATREQINRLNALPGQTEFDIWSPKFGLLWDLDPNAQVFANISRSAEVPSFGESASGPGIPFIPFTDIKAQTATTYEIGTRGRRPDYTWDIALYRMEIENELQCLYSAFGNCSVTNADRTVHQGLELGFGLTLMKDMYVAGPNPDRLWLQVAYTYNDFFFDNDPVFGNNQLPGAPPHYMRSELLYKHPSGFFFGPNMEWVPQAYYVDSANTLMTEPYTIWGLRGGIDTDRYSFYVEGRNLSNTTYIASASIINVANPALPLFEPGSGRAVFLGGKFKW
jgi:iron complex outermembrane receptor protein